VKRIFFQSLKFSLFVTILFVTLLFYTQQKKKEIQIFHRGNEESDDKIARRQFVAVNSRIKSATWVVEKKEASNFRSVYQIFSTLTPSALALPFPYPLLLIRSKKRQLWNTKQTEGTISEEGKRKYVLVWQQNEKHKKKRARLLLGIIIFSRDGKSFREMPAIYNFEEILSGRFCRLVNLTFFFCLFASVLILDTQ
jgi:hypothetical protein